VKLSVRSELIYEFSPETEIIASIQAAVSSEQIVQSERMQITPAVSIRQDGPDAHGVRHVRATLGGPGTLVYEAIVDTGHRAQLPPSVRQHAWSELPADVLEYLSPSRYCPSDRFVAFATREFGDASGGARVLAVLEWIYTHVDYRPGVSNAETDAERTFVDRAGVCRDFSHLGITLCRALNIPARAVSAYAWKLDPPDFHAVFEVFLDGGWWMVDPTRLAPIAGLVRIGVGRDAADVAFLTTSLPCTPVSVTVSVDRAADAAAA
jgi:transglutaminase-like putative cysteine protease